MFVSILTIFAAWHILAAEALDTDMTDLEKKQTGVYKLNDHQKAALQQWIDKHYQKRMAVETSKSITGSHATLSENLMGGRYIRLSDNTLWQIRREDVIIVQSWITPAEIIVTQSTNPFFTAALTNKLTGTSVLGRRVENLPESEPQLAPSDNEVIIPAHSPIIPEPSPSTNVPIETNTPSGP